MRFDVALDPDAGTPDPVIPTLMARAAIRELEEGRSNHFSASGSVQAERRRSSRACAP